MKFDTNPNPAAKQLAKVSIQLNIVHVLRIQRNSYETMFLHRVYYFPLPVYLSRHYKLHNGPKK